MKNNRTQGGANTGDVTPKPLPPYSSSHSNKAPEKSQVSVTTRRNGNSTKSAFSSQESLTGSVTGSVRRKVIPPVPKPPTPVPVKTSKSDSLPPPIRTISNLPSSKSGSLGRKSAYKINSQSNMRRVMSKDRIDLSCNKEKEKENLKFGGSRGKERCSNTCVTILQLEKEKGMMEQQISELVRNAENKKAEIATLRMEINKLKDLQSDDAVEQLKQELDALQLENQALKERLVQLGAPLEMSALSDSQKEQLLLQTSIRQSLNCLKEGQSVLSDAPKSLETEAGEACGTSIPRQLSDWDKASSSSQSEMSVACLQDRIIQMEETHHSTNEELQATLQELTDLQDQLSDLQLDSERMCDEKAVLLESLCSQTEKLEECRSQISQLKQLLFQQYEKHDPSVMNVSDREKHLVELLKKTQEANDLLLVKQDELTAELEVTKKATIIPHTDLILLRDRVRLLESTIESIHAAKRLLESQAFESREQISANQIEISQLKLQLEKEQQKVLELQREREAGATSELNALLQETRKDKEKVEDKFMQLQEQLALSQREVTKYKDQLNQLQDENVLTKNSALKQVCDLEHHIELLEAEKVKLSKEVAFLSEALQQSEMKSQHHLQDKRELKTNVGELQKALNEASDHLKGMQKDMEELRKKHSHEVEDWNKFQADLLTTVRVANDFKTEALLDLEHCKIENKQLKERISSLENENGSLKAKQETNLCTVPLRSSIAFASSDVPALSNVEKDINAAARRQLGTSKARDRGANQLSVKSLIESIENATKQAKGQGPASSCSSSTSSLNSVVSDSRSNPLLFSSGADVFITPPLRGDSTSLLRETKTNGQISRLPRNQSADGVCFSISGGTAISSEQNSAPMNTSEVDSMKPLPAHPVSILANKLDPIRRNSYGDISEKKDPLVSLIKGGGSKRNALLKWCQNKTMGYKNIDITNFSSSWNDGIAFCALMHSYLPDLVPYDDLDFKDKRRNFTVAFEAAESVGIPTCLKINDLISQERPDWQSIMTYVTSIFKHFET